MAITKLEDAQSKVTTELFNRIEHGEEIKLNDKYLLYRYSEEDIYSIVEEKEWLEVLQVMTSDNGFIFEEI